MIGMIVSMLILMPGTSVHAETISQPSEKTTNVQQNSSEPVAANTSSSVAQSPSMTNTSKQTPMATTSDASQPQSLEHHVQPEVSNVTSEAASSTPVNQKEGQNAQRATLTGIQSRATIQPKQAQATSSKTHTILHTNDIHGRLVEEEGRVIGMAKTKTIKDQHHPDLMLDAGDAFQGLPLSNQSKGEEMAKAMNAVGYDAMVAGNHEFDFGFDQLKKLEGMLNFPILSSNVYKNGKLAFKPSAIIEKNGVRYGIIGVTTPETKTKTSPTGIRGVTFDDPLKSVLREMDALNGKVDAFVILSHLGVDSTTQETWRSDYLTQQIQQRSQYTVPTIVIDGHSHTVMQHGQMYGRDLLAQTGTALANVGKIDFNFNNNTVSDLKASLISVKDVAQIQPDQIVKAQVDKANEAFLKETSEVVIPNNKIDFVGERDHVRRHETNLGNAIADAMEAYSKDHFSQPADFAVTNSGGIRASINKGEVTLNHIITVLPFGNTISQIKVKGSDVLAAFEHSLSAPLETVNDVKQLSANGGLLQVSKSIRVYYDMNQSPGKRIKAIHILNKQTGKFEALDVNRVYHVATNDFTASGGDGYTMLNGPREEGLSLDKVFADYLKQADVSQYETTTPTRIINGEPEVLKPNQPEKIIPFPKPIDKDKPSSTKNHGHHTKVLGTWVFDHKRDLTHRTNGKIMMSTSSIQEGVIVKKQHVVSKRTGKVLFPVSALIHYQGQIAYINHKGALVSLNTGKILLTAQEVQKHSTATLPNTGETQQAPVLLGGMLIISGLVLVRRYTA
ncbi:5'-nucleotidase C-terminal domain-containing protein [Staphylococcus hyicus]